MRKIHCQPKLSSSQPPRTGPRTGASTIGTPMIDMTRPMFLGPAARASIIWPTGRVMPPPIPCSTRKATSDSTFQATAQSAVKATSAVR